MITIHVIYPGGRIVERRLYASQAQGIINAMRRDGATVVIISNETGYVIE